MRQRRGDPADKKVNVTIGEYIEAVAGRSLFSPKTLKSYAQALRKVAGNITGETKREKRDAIRLRALTPEKIEAWRIEFIRRKATDPSGKKAPESRRVASSCVPVRSSVLRRLRGSVTLWSFRNRCHLAASRSRRCVCHATGAPSTWRSCSKAQRGVGTSRPEQYKIFLLGALAGLRRNEIDVLPWTAFRWNEGVIRIETTEFYRPKSHNSEGDVIVDPELMEVFRGFTRGARATLSSRATRPRCPLMRPMAPIVAWRRCGR